MYNLCLCTEWRLCKDQGYCKKLKIDSVAKIKKENEYAQKKENIEKIPKDLPLYLVAGSDDPVGNFGKSVENVAKTYRECGIKDVSLKLYEKDRHEILNELDRQTVYEDILAWVEAHLI